MPFHPGPSLSVRAACLALLVCLSGLLGCGNSAVPAASSTGTGTVTSPAVPPSIWVGAWGDAITNAAATHDNTGGTDQTFRFVVVPTVAGSRERVRFSNLYGTAPLTIGAARLSLGHDGSPAIDPARDAPLTFSGQSSVVLQPGTTITSDPVSLTYSFGEVFAVSVFLRGAFPPLPRHDSLFMTNFRTSPGTGDATADTSGAAFTSTSLDWLVLNGIDVYGPYQGTIALFGSSTTDGYKSDYSSDHIYPDPNLPVPGQHTSRLSDALARRFNAAGYHVGVVNLGVPGDTVTPDITNTLNQVRNANDRIASDLLTLPNLLAAVTYFGSIDIRSPDCKSAPSIESATTQLASTAHAARVPLLIATIPPSAFCTNPAQGNYGPVPTPADPFAGGSMPGPANGGELQRMAFNSWIRSVGATLPGVLGVADFDAALADPARPNFLLPRFNSGDNYHPNGAGYQAEAESLSLSTLVDGH